LVAGLADQAPSSSQEQAENAPPMLSKKPFLID
jgi:hypothetical protein